MTYKINISDGKGNKFLLPIDSDRSLTLETLNSAFYGATNLYIPSDGRAKSLMQIENGKIFNPDGWQSDVEYVALFQDSMYKEQIDEKKQSTSDPNSSAVNFDPENKINDWEKSLLYSHLYEQEFEDGPSVVIETKEVKNCVVSFLYKSMQFYVTFFHGSHSSHVKGKEMKLYNKEGKEFLAEVISSAGRLDFIILKPKGPAFPHSLLPKEPERDENYVILGYPSFEEYENQILIDIRGSILTVEKNEHMQIIGDGGAWPGLSGGPVINSDGYLLGICLGGPDPPEIKKDPNASDLTDFSKRTILLEEAFRSVSRRPYCRILPYSEIRSELAKCEEIDHSPDKKRFKLGLSFGRRFVVKRKEKCNEINMKMRNLKMVSLSGNDSTENFPIYADVDLVSSQILFVLNTEKDDALISDSDVE